MNRTDKQLILEYVEGDDKALGILVDRYLSDAYNFAFNLTKNSQSAEDITQESFVKAWKNIRKFTPTNSFKSWLFRIVRNTAIDILRKRKDIPFSVFENGEGENYLLTTLVDTDPLPDELFARAEDVRYIENLLEQINPEYREVLILRSTSNLTFEEIGETLKRPLQTVKSQYRRALIALRRLAMT